MKKKHKPISGIHRLKTEEEEEKQDSRGMAQETA